MKTRILLSYILLVALASCSKNDPTARDLSHDNKSGFTEGSIFELRGTGADQKSTRFIGKGFNLLEHRIGDESGICTGRILDLKRIEQNATWSPWCSKIPTSLVPPEILTEEVYRDIEYSSVRDVSSSYSQDSLDFSLGLKFKKIGLSFKYTDVSQEKEKLYHARYNAYKLEEKVYLESDDDEDFQFYLRPRFVKHLSTMSTDQLIATYGTHLITNYNLGAFTDLVVTAKSSIFSKEEVLSLAATAVDKSRSLTASTRKKVEKNILSLKTTYRQGGSDYKVEFITPTTLFNASDPIRIDIAQWAKKLRGNDGTFLSLDVNKSGLIPIPNLIADFPLKIKYTCGILHKAHPGKRIVYVLCDPENYTPIKHKGEYIYTSLNKYDTQVSYVYYGNNSAKRISEKELSSKGSNNASWSCDLNKDNRWVIYKSAINKYLCRDLILRTKEEDPNGLRYWGLNPIIPTEGYSATAWSRMMVQAKK